MNRFALDISVCVCICQVFCEILLVSLVLGNTGEDIIFLV